MSLSEALGPYPVVRHFYPINPQTAFQQQSAVVNASEYPLVAPIMPASSQPPPRESRPKNIKKRKIKEDDSEYVDDDGESLVMEKLFRPARKPKRPRLQLSQVSSEPPVIHLSLRKQRRIPYVKLPENKSIDLSLYRPLSLTSLGSHPRPGRNKRHKHSRLSSLPFDSHSTFSLSANSEPSTPLDGRNPDDLSEIHVHKKRPGIKRKQRVKHEIDASPSPTVANAPGDEASTCHQCRRKTDREKMRCRKIRPDGTICPVLFCQGCVELRYDETFNPLHCTWLCPRCRGICNCSICLRKAGFGYILDGAISEQLTGVQGRLSSGRGRRGRIKMEDGESNENCAQEPWVSVREWLARRGIALGNKEWMEERRRQGVRFVVGMEPPPLDVPSPYKEAHLNPVLAALAEDAKDEDDIDLPLDPKFSGTDSKVSTELAPVDSVASMSLHMEGSDTPSTPLGRPDSGSAAGNPYNEVAPNLPVDQTSNEDLPGLSRASTYGVSLFIGKRLTRTKKKKQHLGLKVKKKKVSKAKKKVDANDADDSDHDYDNPTSPMTASLPRIRVRKRGLPEIGSSLPAPAVQNDEKDDEKDFVANTSFSSSHEREHTLSFADNLPETPPPPPPPPEPVLVPTEHYTPSKLDATMVKESESQFGHTYWSLNTFTPRPPPPPPEYLHNATSSLLSQTPLFSHSDPYQYPQLSLEDLSPMEASDTASGSAFTSMVDAHSRSLSSPLSKSHPPNDYLNSHLHLHTREDTFSSNSLGSFTTLEDLWNSDDVVHIGNIDVDPPPLQVEGVARAINAALHKH